MDIEYVNLMIGLIALVSSFISHLRHSRCCYGLVDIDMKRQNTPPDTPYEDNREPINNHSESVALLSESKSEAILIPEKPKIKNWL
jgi:hypothetical protein